MKEPPSIIMLPGVAEVTELGDDLIASSPEVTCFQRKREHGCEREQRERKSYTAEVERAQETMMQGLTKSRQKRQKEK